MGQICINYITEYKSFSNNLANIELMQINYEHILNRLNRIIHFDTF